MANPWTFEPDGSDIFEESRRRESKGAILTTGLVFLGGGLLGSLAVLLYLSSDAAEREVEYRLLMRRSARVFQLERTIREHRIALPKEKPPSGD